MKSTIQRRFALLLGAALVVMAFAAPGASAAMTVKDAATGQLCPAVSPPLNPKTEQEQFSTLFNPQTYTSGGCTVHVKAKTNMIISYTGEGCLIDYDLHIGPNGWGYADKFKINNNVGGCGLHWGAYSLTKSVAAVAPGEVNPYGAFYASNAETDFNFHQGIKKGEWGPWYAWVSLNATQENPLLLSNQALSGAVSKGSWQGDAGLLITH